MHRRTSVEGPTLATLLKPHSFSTRNSPQFCIVTLIDKEVVPGKGFFPQQTHGVILGVGVGHDLVEDVVIPLDLQLEGDAGLFQEVSFDIGGGDFQVAAEVNSDELALNTCVDMCTKIYSRVWKAIVDPSGIRGKHVVPDPVVSHDVMRRR